MGMFCAKCGTHASGQAMAPAARSPIQEEADRRAWYMRELDRRVATERHGVAAILSFFIPGLGQLVKGQIIQGAGVFVVAVGCGMLSAFIIGIPMLALWWILQIWDAYVKPDAQLAAELRNAMAPPRRY
jgi:TM2 domain-containing membrane protein YozV